MKQLTIAFTTLLTATLAMSNVVSADEQADKQAIIEAYHTIDTAIQRKDFNQASFFYAPEFTQVEMDGKVKNLEQIRKGMQQFLQNTRQINIMREQQIKINGQTATVVGTGYQNAIISNSNNPQVPVPVSSVFQYQDTWKRTDNGWKATNAHILQSKTTGGEQSSQVRQQNLTPAQRESLEVLRAQLRLENLRTLQNGLYCIIGTAYNCGR